MQRDQIIAGLIAALELEITKSGGVGYLKARTADKYRTDIFAAAKQFWRDGSRGGLITRLKEITKFGLRDAWDEGGKALGITPDDYTEQDLAMRDEIITEEQSHITDLADYLDKLANTPETPLSAADSRLDTWARRFPDVVNRAKIAMGKDAKLEWVFGDTVHCKSCARLNGIVKRASFWQSHGVQPKNPPNEKIDCGGWKCECVLNPTDKPLTRGRLPALP